MEFFTQFPVMERVSLMELKKGIDLSFRLFSRKYGDAIENFFDKKELKVFKDYSYDLNDNIINYGWKIKSVKITNDKAIYTLSKNKWIMYCVVFFANEEIETTCRIP